MTSVTTTLQAGTDNQHFCYDEQNRLSWAWSNGSSPCGSFSAGTLTAAQYQQSYTYDPNGRLTSAQSGYTYGDSHHLHAVTSTGSGYSAAYDAAGNMTCRAPSSATTCAGTQTGQQLSYDAEGNLSTWQNQPSPTSTVNYLYDGEGTRVASQLVSGGNTTLTSYIGKLETVVAGSSTSTTTYYYAGALRIAEAVNGTFSYLGNDVLGSTAVALNAAGQLTAAQLYGPYGTVRYSSGTMPTDIGFTGQRGDSATGLDYYGARYYNPVVGQFISADTMLPGNGFDPWGLSRYAYVQGNPETMTDPAGHRWASAGGTETAWLNPVTGGLYTSTKESWIYGGGYKIDYFTPQERKNPWYDPLKDKQNSTWAKINRGIHGISNWLASISYTGGPGMGACLLSFAPATKVATAQGAKAISSLRPGDKVWAYNPKMHKMELQPIVHVWINHDDDLVDLTVTSETSPQHGKPEQKAVETIHTNQKHPFLTVEKGFVPVSQLRIGMHLVKADHGTGVVTKLETIPGTMAMFNLEVANDHTFTVGEGKWIVHNCTSGGFDTSPFSNSQDLSGASMDQLVSRVPQDASVRVLVPYQTPTGQPSGVKEGFEYTWKDGDIIYTLRVHGPNSNAPPGSNAASGWNWRLFKEAGGQTSVLKSDGTWVTEDKVTFKSPTFSEEDMNLSHIPMQNYTGDTTVAPSPTGPRIIPDDPFTPEEPDVPGIE